MNPLAYYELKAAQALFDKPCGALVAGEARKVAAVARRYATIEAAVLASPEARGVCLPEDAVCTALDEIRGRYPDADAYAADLAAAGLDVDGLEQALQRDLLVDTVLARVGANAGNVGAVEAEIFYYSHLDRFHSPERRTARHILITVNEALPDNRPEVALRRIEAIARRVAAKPERFEEQAGKHSECPTALQGGLLGDIARGQLYPALDAALFAMKAGETSAVLKSELGYHVLRCDAVQPARTVPYAEVAASLRERLSRERSDRHAREWLAQLLARVGATTV